MFRSQIYRFWYPFGLCSLLIGGVAAVSYSAALYLIAGLLIGFSISLMVSFMWSVGRNLRTRHRLGYLIVLMICFTLLVVSVFDPLIVFFHGPCASVGIYCSTVPPTVQEHYVEIAPINLGRDQFKVQERFTFSSNYIAPIHLPSRIVYGESSGSFLRKLTVVGPAQRKIQIPLADGSLGKYNICGYNCAPVSVLLYDFPPGAFYAAEAAEQPLSPAYPGLGKFSWTIPTFYSGRPQNIVFWYHPTTSPVLLLLLRPFAGIASLGKFALVAIGFIVSALMTYLLLPLVQEIIKKWIQVRLLEIFRRWQKGPRS